jgi:hypothetical protein
MAAFNAFGALGFLAWCALGFGLLVLGKFALEMEGPPPGFEPKGWWKAWLKALVG